MALLDRLSRFNGAHKQRQLKYMARLTNLP
jgi:hypothetical protein